MLHIVDAPSIDRLRQVLGLTSSGTVRLVDRLSAAGLVTRRSGDDGRTTVVGLTDAGRTAARAVTDARAGVLSSALEVLDGDERATFDALAGKILGEMIREPGAVRWGCRMCDTGACGRYEGRCPIALAAQRKYFP